MSRLTRDGTAEPVSRDQILRHARGQGNIHFPCSAGHEQDWQPYPVDPYSAICDDHTYIHTYIYYSDLKVAVNTIVPRSPFFFFFCTSKPRLLHTSEKTRSNISVNEMALFVLFPTCAKGKTFIDIHGERGGLPTRRDSGPTRYGCAPH